MHWSTPASLRRLMAGLLVLGIVVGIVLAQVVAPAATGLALGARDWMGRAATVGAVHAQSVLTPAQPVQVQFQQTSWPDIVEKIGPAGVTVVSDIGGGAQRGGFGSSGPAAQAVGSGVIVDERGYLVTNNHVVAEGRNYQVLFADGVAVVRAAGATSAAGGGGDVAEGLGFAIPSNTVRDVVQQLIDHGSVVRPYMGVSFQTVNPRVAAYYDLGVKDGALVTQVGPNSPARNAGIQQGDVITRVDG